MLPKRTESLDRLLLDQGLITPQQLTEALQYQCRLPTGQEMNLAEVLIALEFVTEKDINHVLGNRAALEDVLLQQLVQDGLIEQEHLEDALKNLNSWQDEKRTGTVLLEMGYTTKEMIEAALKHYYQKQHPNDKSPISPPHQPPPGAVVSTDMITEEVVQITDPVGQILIQKGLITPGELQDAIDYQYRLPRILHKPLGEILVLLGYVSQQQLEEALTVQVPPPSDRLGDILVSMGVIEQWQLSHVLCLKYQQEYSHKKLGSLLVEMGYARRVDIEMAMKEFLDRQQNRHP